MEDKDNQTLQNYKNNYKIIKEYLEELLINIKKVINNPVVREKYNKERKEKMIEVGEIWKDINRI